MTENCVKTPDWKVCHMHLETFKKPFFFFSQILKQCVFFILKVLCYTIPRALKMSKNETIVANGSKIRFIII